MFFEVERSPVLTSYISRNPHHLAPEFLAQRAQRGFAHQFGQRVVRRGGIRHIDMAPAVPLNQSDGGRKADEVANVVKGGVGPDNHPAC